MGVPDSIEEPVFASQAERRINVRTGGEYIDERLIRKGQQGECVP